jgi:hypothetical protein
MLPGGQWIAMMSSGLDSFNVSSTILGFLIEGVYNEQK